MAGSFSHIGSQDGAWSLIENMGDAAEAVEQLLWLVLRTVGPRQAETLLDTEFYPMKRHERTPDQAFYEVQSRMER